MDDIRNISVLIGRENGSNSLIFAVTIAGQHKIGRLSEPAMVPNSVSRCVPDRNKAHCRLDFNARGEMTLTNLKAANCTFVNGLQIEAARVSKADRVELGPDRYPVSLHTIVAMLSKVMPKSQPKTADVRHFKAVWREYKRRIDYIKKKQQQLAILSRTSSLFFMGAGAVGGVLKAAMGKDDQLIGNCLLVSSCIGLAVLVVSIYMQWKFNAAKESDAAKEWLKRHYRCPNCHKIFLQEYDILRNDYSACPKCKSEFIY